MKVGQYAADLYIVRDLFIVSVIHEIINLEYFKSTVKDHLKNYNLALNYTQTFETLF